jgi:RNA polymerase sigma factor (sigma-70 family)
MDLEKLYLDNLALIERIIALTCRRQRLTKEEGEDFASEVTLKLLANDYEVLRRFSGRCTLAGYLTTVVQHAFLDHRNHLWGKWRPCAEAKRLGPLAIKLDMLMNRDRMSLEAACATVPAEDREAMRALAPRIPVRVKRTVEGTAELDRMPASDGSPEAHLLSEERERAAAGLERILAVAVEGLSAEDRLLIQLRLGNGVSLANVARSYGQDARQLYRRWETLLRRLRGTLEREGWDAGRVAWVLGSEGGAGAETGASRPSTETGQA